MEQGNVVISDKTYPSALKKIGKEAPETLYYKGFWEQEIFANCLAAVGSRRMTNYGREVINKVVGELASSGLTIVSGFMYGCDAQAHKTCLAVGGRTVAVMPCGIKRVHPEYQEDLYQDILNNKGLVVSEYPGDIMPSKWTYPRRNRIVAGLSQAVLIIEAAEGSGSLITAHWAKKFGRKIFVVPGPITSENSKGITSLMREGAEPVAGAQDILEYYKIKSKLQNLKPKTNNKLEITKSKTSVEEKIIDHLRREPIDIDGLSRSFGLSASELGVVLSMMEVKNQVRSEGGKYYVN